MVVWVGGVCNRAIDECRTMWQRSDNEVMTPVRWQRIYWQRDWKDVGQLRHNDLAIIQLAQQIRHMASNSTHYACLTPPNEVRFTTRPVLIAGWGLSDRNHGQYLGPEQPSWAANMSVSPLLRFATLKADRRMSAPLEQDREAIWPGMIHSLIIH